MHNINHVLHSLIIASVLIISLVISGCGTLPTRQQQSPGTPTSSNSGASSSSNLETPASSKPSSADNSSLLTLSDILGGKEALVRQNELSQLSQYQNVQYKRSENWPNFTTTLTRFHDEKGNEIFSIEDAGEDFGIRVEVDNTFQGIFIPVNSIKSSLVLANANSQWAGMTNEEILSSELGKRYGKTFSPVATLNNDATLLRCTCENDDSAADELGTDNKTHEYSVGASINSNGNVELFDDYYWKMRKDEVEAFFSQPVKLAYEKNGLSGVEVDTFVSGTVPFSIPLHESLSNVLEARDITVIISIPDSVGIQQSHDPTINHLVSDLGEVFDPMNATIEVLMRPKTNITWNRQEVFGANVQTK